MWQHCKLKHWGAIFINQTCNHVALNLNLSYPVISIQKMSLSTNKGSDWGRIEKSDNGRFCFPETGNTGSRGAQPRPHKISNALRCIEVDQSGKDPLVTSNRGVVLEVLVAKVVKAAKNQLKVAFGLLVIRSVQENLFFQSHLRKLRSWKSS